MPFSSPFRLQDSRNSASSFWQYSSSVTYVVINSGVHRDPGPARPHSRVPRHHAGRRQSAGTDVFNFKSDIRLAIVRNPPYNFYIVRVLYCNISHQMTSSQSSS